jgi:hypothetical protein
MEGLSFEERYLRLRDEHGGLTQRCNEQEDTIRRMNTKLAQIEKSLKLKQRLDASGAAPLDSAQVHLIADSYMSSRFAVEILLLLRNIRRSKKFGKLATATARQQRQ